MKVLRSTLVIGLAAFAAACGDKVTVAGPPTTDTTPKVNSVTVTPAAVTMAVGQTASFSAAVSVSNGAATTVTWSSSDASKVSVTAAGVATAVASTPGVAICATSTADANQKGCASVVVTSTTVTPPSISIASVNFTNALGQQQPAPPPPAGVGGQLNVVMNVNAGSAVLDSVVLKVGGKNAYKQTFSAQQASALAAAALSPEFQSTGATITAPVNTADYNTTTGAATWQNGNQAIQAFIYGKNSVQAGSSPTNVQGNSPVTTYRFANADGFQLTSTYTLAGAGVRTAGETQVASAVDAAGFGWKAGAIGISALFVQYTPGITPTIVTASFNNLGCSAGGVRAIALTNSGTGAAGPWTGTFSNTATAGATNVTGYEWNPALVGCAGASFTSGGEIPAIAAVGSDNNNIALVGGGVNGGAGILNTFANSLNPDPNIVVRLDNVGPGTVTYNAQSTNSANANCAAGAATTSMGGRTNCWFNDAVVLNGRQTGFAGVAASQTSTNGLIASAADLGSGRVIGTSDGLTIQARVGLSTDASSTVDASAAVTSTAGLAESATATAYRVRTRITDLLGNTTNSGSNSGVASTTGGIFGVDRTVPALAFVGGPAANARGVAPGGAYTFGATDNSVAPAAPSGFFNLAATPLTVTSTRREATIGTRFFCAVTATYINTSSTANPCAGANGWPSGTTPTYLANLVVSDNNASALDAYYTISATVADQAGNVSAAASRVELIDATAPSIGGLSYPPFLTQGGTATFTSQVIDNLDLQLDRMNLQYGPAGGAPGAFAATLFDANTGAAFAPTTAVGGSSFWYPDVAINAYNASPLVTTFAMSNTVTNLYTNIQVTGTTTGTSAAALNAAGFLNTANGVVLNQANTATASATPIIAGALPATQTAIGNTGAAGSGPVNWFICGTTGTITAGTACPAVPAALAAATIPVSRDGNTAGQDQAVTFDAVATGTTAVFNNPFSSVQFWAYNPAAATEGWRLIGTVTNSSTVTDGGLAVPNGRNWHFLFTWNPTSTDAPSNAGTVYRVVAVGIGGANLTTATSQGSAIATPLGGITITINP